MIDRITVPENLVEEFERIKAECAKLGLNGAGVEAMILIILVAK